MPNYKVTLFMAQGGRGFNESYYTMGASGTGLAAQINDLIAKRRQLLFSNVSITGMRISDASSITAPGTPRATQLIYPLGAKLWDTGLLIDLPGNGAITNPLAGLNPTLLNTSLQCRFAFNITRQGFKYLAGIPRGIVGADPATLVPDGVDGWSDAWTAWKGVMNSGAWGIKYQKQQGEVSVYSVVGRDQSTDNPPLLRVLVNTTGATGLNRGVRVHLQNFRPPKFTRLPTINGVWILAANAVSVEPNVYALSLLNSEAIVPSQVNFTDKTFVRIIQYGFAPTTQYDWHRVTSHKRGKPTLAPAGRRLHRPTLDP